MLAPLTLIGVQEWYVCPMTSAIASGGQCEVPEGVQMLWEAELGAACQNLLAGGVVLSWQVFTIACLHEVVISHSCSLALQ